MGSTASKDASAASPNSTEHSRKELSTSMDELVGWPVEGSEPSTTMTATITVPQSIVIMTGSATVAGSLYSETPSLTDESSSMVSSMSDTDLVSSTSPKQQQQLPPQQQFQVQAWDGVKHFADYIHEGLQYLGKPTDGIIMLFESPSAVSTQETSFYNSQVYKFHDFPPSPTIYKAVLAPCRYSLMNGDVYPSYLKDPAPDRLIEHWKSVVPGFVEPSFTHVIPPDATVYAYLPIEHLPKHLNDPHVHYHLAGKDALHLMTTRTTRLLANTQTERPCVCKTTHSMASKGIFIIRNDDDENAFNKFLSETGNPTYVVTEYVEIERNIACHFFIHPNGQVTWFGSNENRKMPDGSWSTDSTIVMSEQDELRDIQLPFVKDVVQYCHSLGFWGSCGVDVLMDKSGKGYLVDLNPRVTGSCPSLMVARRLYEKYGYDYCLFRRNSKFGFPGTADQLLSQVEAYNAAHEGESMVVLISFCQVEPTLTLVNINVHSRNSLDECEDVLNQLAPLRENLADDEDD